MNKRSISIVGTVIVFATSLITFLVAPIPDPPLDQILGHEWFYRFSSAHQKVAHKIALLSIASIGILFMILNYREALPTFPKQKTPHLNTLLMRPGFLVCFVLLVTCGAENHDDVNNWIWAATISTILFVAPYWRPFRTRLPSSMLYLGIVILLATPTLLILTGEIAFTRWGGFHESHITALWGAANYIAGQEALSNPVFGYGAIFPTIMGYAQKILSFGSMKTQFSITLLFQAFFMLLSIVALRRWNARHPLYLLIGILALFPFLAEWEKLIFVNSSSIRFMNFAVGTLIILYLDKVPRKRGAVLLGSACAWQFLYNPETGIAITLGSLAYLITQHHFLDLKKVVGVLLYWLIGALMAFGVIDGIIVHNTGHSSLQVLFSAMFLFEKGYGGLPLYYDSIIIVIFLHMTYISLKSAANWGKSELSVNSRRKLYLSVTILVWFAYYINRPHDRHLYTFFPLYMFFIVDMCDIRRLRLYWEDKFKGLKSFRLALPIVILTIVFLPVLGKEAYTNIKRIHSHTRANSDSKKSLVEVDGIFLPQATAKSIQTRVSYLKQKKNENPLILTENTYSIPLMAQYFPEEGLLDINMELPSRGYTQIIRQILTPEASEIWFDQSPSLPRYTKDQGKLWKQIRKDISDVYTMDKIEQGWEIWKRIPSN